MLRRVHFTKWMTIVALSAISGSKAWAAGKIDEHLAGPRARLLKSQPASPKDLSKTAPTDRWAPGFRPNQNVLDQARQEDLNSPVRIGPVDPSKAEAGKTQEQEVGKEDLALARAAKVHYFELADLQNGLIPDLDVVKTGKAPRQSLQLVGKAPIGCLDKLHIEFDEDRSGKTVGFRISENDQEFSLCVQTCKVQSWKNRGECLKTSLSSLEDAKAQVADRSAKVVLYLSAELDEIDEVGISIQSKRDLEIEDAIQIVRECRGTEGQLDDAEEKLAFLRDVGALKGGDEEYEEMQQVLAESRDVVKMEKVADFGRRVRDSADAQELGSVEREMMAWGRNNPAYSKYLADQINQAAIRELTLRDPSNPLGEADNIGRAKSLLDRANKLRGLNQDARTKLAMMDTYVDAKQVESSAFRPSPYGDAFYWNYNRYVQSLDGRYRSGGCGMADTLGAGAQTKYCSYLNQKIDESYSLYDLHEENLQQMLARQQDRMQQRVIAQQRRLEQMRLRQLPPGVINNNGGVLQNNGIPNNGTLNGGIQRHQQNAPLMPRFEGVLPPGELTPPINPQAPVSGAYGRAI